MPEILGFISAASARKRGSAQAQCSQPQSRPEEGDSAAQHLRSGLTPRGGNVAYSVRSGHSSTQGMPARCITLLPASATQPEDPTVPVPLCCKCDRNVEWVLQRKGGGRQTAWEMGPTCSAWWMAALLQLHVSRLPGGGQGCPPLHILLLRFVLGRGGKGSPATPRPRRAPVPAVAGGGRLPPAPSPPGKAVAQRSPPLPTRYTQTPTRAQTFVLLIWCDQVGSAIASIIGCNK
ncbi:uncharacterized protein [Excalfactoria chinensis]|uniref:uncharacterized protein n=1 Tax=Excalfactoria chinensis TaxID=46218 RepID=UPI003B3BD2FB